MDNVVEGVAGLVVDVAEDCAAARSGAVVHVAAAPAKACSTCPWRVSNQQRPPLDARRRTPAMYYGVEGRRAMWESWTADGQGLVDGCSATCHLPVGEATQMRWCGGGEALLAREVLRWWLTGCSALDFGPLRGVDAVHRVLATIVGESFTSNLELRRVGDRLVPELYGMVLPVEFVADLVHPAVLDPDVGCEATAPLTAGEFNDLPVGVGWAEAGGNWETVALGS